MALVNKDNLTEAEFLKNYRSEDYQKPSVTADILLFTLDRATSNSNQLKVLLIKRNDHPFIDCWAIPGGFMNINEGIEETAYRELKEETSIVDNVYLEQLYTFGNDVKRDPRMRVLTCAYMSLTPFENIKNTKASDDAKEAIWFNVTKAEINHTDCKRKSILHLENEENEIVIEYLVEETYKNKKISIDFTHIENTQSLAFDHYMSINMALDRMKNKISYTDIAFSLLPEKFTLNELQSVYETILGTKLEKSNFRKSVMSKLIPTNSVKTDVSYRPPKYYKFNPFYKTF